MYHKFARIGVLSELRRHELSNVTDDSRSFVAKRRYLETLVRKAKFTGLPPDEEDTYLKFLVGVFLRNVDAVSVLAHPAFEARAHATTFRRWYLQRVQQDPIFNLASDLGDEEKVLINDPAFLDTPT